MNKKEEEAFGYWHDNTFVKVKTTYEYNKEAWEDGKNYKQKEVDELKNDIRFLLELHGYDPDGNDYEIISKLKEKYL